MLNSPYFRIGRFDKPIGIVLLLFPCWWGLALASGLRISLYLMLLFAIGATVMRGAGCLINDIFDRKFDQQVTRTKLRPLANGELSVKQVLTFFVILSAIGLLVLVQLPYRCWSIGVIAAGLLFIYPLTKRVTHWPQLFLGLAFNIGLLIAVAAISPAWTDPTIFVVYFAAICWTIAYDTVYALQDIEDDLKIGIGSTVILFGKYVKPIIGLFYGLMSIGILTSGWMLGSSNLFYLFTIFAGGYALFKVFHLNIKDTRACHAFFIDNQWIGLLIFLAYLFR